VDAVKRGNSRLRRVQITLGESISEGFYHVPFSARSWVSPPAGHNMSLRSAIDDTVVTFLPPSPSAITDGGVRVIGANAQISYNRLWGICIRIEATQPVPTMFIAGFMMNVDGGWGGIIGVLNRDGHGNAETFAAMGASQWIQSNFPSARAQGVTFRVVSTTILEGRMRDFAVTWANTFDRGLGRPFSLLDTDKDWYWQIEDSMVGVDMPLDDTPADDQLSFAVSLRFE
jgi:hypothetical protein